MRSHAVVALSLLACVAAQTYSSCNPLDTTGCPADTALGESISVDFTQGSVDSFTASGGNPTYDSNGASFTVAQSGDAPQLTSVFYIMFGKVEFVMKAAPGAGIVSSLVLESDDLDEIDMEWLGADGTQVQTNYFGKGNVTTYNRGVWNPADGNQDNFIKYTVDWTQDQIAWYVGDNVVRTLTPATADANQYPQTPMRVKFGAWSGGDPSNPPGTISWARGPTNYADGPFTMVVQSIGITDYSTGTSYTYSDQSGDWESIVATDGTINGNSGGSATVTVAPSSVTNYVSSVPPGIGAQTGWPWVATPTSAAPTNTYTAAGVPSGWTIGPDGKLVPALAPAVTVPYGTGIFALILSMAAFF